MLSAQFSGVKRRTIKRVRTGCDGLPYDISRAFPPSNRDGYDLAGIERDADE
jgi:hypothetical protein